MKKTFARIFAAYAPHIIATVCVLAVITVYLLSDVECPIKYLTGIPCAGCGMTRACVSAAKLDFVAAFEYHPLWIIMPLVAFLLVFFKIKKMHKCLYGTLAVTAALMIIVWIARIFLCKTV